MSYDALVAVGVLGLAEIFTYPLYGVHKRKILFTGIRICNLGSKVVLFGLFNEHLEDFKNYRYISAFLASTSSSILTHPLTRYRELGNFKEPYTEFSKTLVKSSISGIIAVPLYDGLLKYTNDILLSGFISLSLTGIVNNFSDRKHLKTSAVRLVPLYVGLKTLDLYLNRK